MLISRIRRTSAVAADNSLNCFCNSLSVDEANFARCIMVSLRQTDLLPADSVILSMGNWTFPAGKGNGAVGLKRVPGRKTHDNILSPVGSNAIAQERVPNTAE